MLKTYRLLYGQQIELFWPKSCELQLLTLIYLIKCSFFSISTVFFIRNIFFKLIFVYTIMISVKNATKYILFWESAIIYSYIHDFFTEILLFTIRLKKQIILTLTVPPRQKLPIWSVTPTFSVILGLSQSKNFGVTWFGHLPIRIRWVTD